MISSSSTMHLYWLSCSLSSCLQPQYWHTVSQWQCGVPSLGWQQMQTAAADIKHCCKSVRMRQQFLLIILNCLHVIYVWGIKKKQSKHFFFSYFSWGGLETKWGGLGLPRPPRGYAPGVTCSLTCYIFQVACPSLIVDKDMVVTWVSVLPMS